MDPTANDPVERTRTRNRGPGAPSEAGVVGAGGRDRGRSAEDAVYAALRGEIEHGLAPGTPLRLSVIAGRMATSTMPVRAALKHLESDGLVRQLPRRGAVVAPLELEDIEEIQAIRWGIEGLAARLGAQAAGPADLHAMRGHLDQARAAAERRDEDAYLEATYDLEDRCYAAAGRPRLLATVRHYRRAALRYVRVVIGARPHLEVPPAERFMAAAEAGDGPLAERLIQAEITRLFGVIADRMADGSALQGGGWTGVVAPGGGPMA